MTDSKKKSQRRAKPNGSYKLEDTVEVYKPGFNGLVIIPSEKVYHTPPRHFNVSRLVLCGKFSSDKKKNACTMGHRCKFVHADWETAKEVPVHVNYAWRSIYHVEYERFPEGMTFDVAFPNEAEAKAAVASQLVLKTKALEAERRPLTHCAHYYYNRACNRGPDCNFIHAVHIDPTAENHQRAPAPPKNQKLQQSARSTSAVESANEKPDPALLPSKDETKEAAAVPKNLKTHEGMTSPCKAMSVPSTHLPDDLDGSHSHLEGSYLDGSYFDYPQSLMSDRTGATPLGTTPRQSDSANPFRAFVEMTQSGGGSQCAALSPMQVAFCGGRRDSSSSVGNNTASRPLSSHPTPLATFTSEGDASSAPVHLTLCRRLAAAEDINGNNGGDDNDDDRGSVTSSCDEGPLLACSGRAATRVFPSNRGNQPQETDRTDESEKHSCYIHNPYAPMMVEFV